MSLNLNPCAQEFVSDFVTQITIMEINIKSMEEYLLKMVEEEPEEEIIVILSAQTEAKNKKSYKDILIKTEIPLN